ncbi:MAG: bile acid:sodium symporter family protein [Deltaproteobacteria bacterium]|nr:bile acid:sodium symporter family protein [Deltaproteobacteria bacterium]
MLFTLGMGMTLSLTDFVEIVRRPWSFAAALVGQLLLVPCVAVLLNWLFEFDHGIAIGMILVAAMPGGALAKFFAYFGRGNMALSISLTGVTTLMTLITVPAMMQWLAAQHIPKGFAMPVATIMIDVTLCLLVPLVAGLTIARTWPAQHLLLSKICIRVGLVVVVLMIVGSFGSGFRAGKYGLGPPIALVLFCLIGQQLNMLPFRIFGWPRQDRLAAGIEITMRNMNLALLIKTSMFPPEYEWLDGVWTLKPNEMGDGVLFMILFYAGAAMCVGLPLAFNHRRLAQAEAASTPEDAAVAETAPASPNP